MKLNRNVNSNVVSKLYIASFFALVMFSLTALAITLLINSDVASIYVGFGITIFFIPSKYHQYLLTNIITFPITLWLYVAVIALKKYYNHKTQKNYLPKAFFYSTEFDDYATKSITSQK